MRSFITLSCLSLLTSAAIAQTQEKEVEETVVTGLRQRLYEAGMLKDVIQKTEIISSVSIEQSNSSNLSEALKSAPGVRVNNECSMCGVKRVMINGLRGEHTTILVDGIPAYTMMSGFYGLDAATTASVEQIEIARGAGASLIAPEAIGGTINLISKDAQENALDLDLSSCESGEIKATAVGSLVANDGTTKLTLSGQFDQTDLYDGDDNGVGESPDQENQTLTLLLSQDIGRSDNLRIRGSHVESEILGGPADISIDEIKAGYFSDPDWESPEFFVDGDVRNEYIGRPWETAEWISTSRDEVYVTWLHEFSAKLNSSITVSHNKHTQDSFYEGFIYEADNTMVYLDARFNYALNNSHLFTFGADNRDEELRSETNSDSPKYVSDSFDYKTTGLYLQDTWTVTEDLQISGALRFDNVTADFIDPKKAGKEIDESIVSPRIDIKYSHSDAWTSRLSAGRGYRAPLSFFESDHGILDGDLGFDINIEKLERSRSINYALSYEGTKLAVTTSVAQTTIDNLTALEETEDGVPVLNQMQEEADTWVADIALSYDLIDNLTVTSTAESIHYSDNFKKSFGVVPVEKRITLALDWMLNGFNLYGAATWVGSRDLKAYGTPENPTFDYDGNLPKKQTAESYWTFDFRVSKEINDMWQVYFGASNLFDYSQAKDMETPLFYEDGGYDVGHIYGPLRGRELFAGVKISF